VAGILKKKAFGHLVEKGPNLEGLETSGLSTLGLGQVRRDSSLDFNLAKNLAPPKGGLENLTN